MAAAIQGSVGLSSCLAPLSLRGNASRTTRSAAHNIPSTAFTSSFMSRNLQALRRFSHADSQRQSRRPVRALFGGGGSKTEKKKKGIKREEEPQEYFQTKAEKQGKSTFADPLAIIGILSILLPFIILGAAFSAGLVKLPS